MTCFMLVLVVFSTTMRFGSIDSVRLIESNFISLNSVDDKTEIDYSSLDRQNKDSDNQPEKEPLSLKKSTSSDALLHGIITPDFFQNIILTPSVEFLFYSFSSHVTENIRYYFSSSSFFKILFSCFISPNAP